jgi:tRNA dimethylallyltransferase
VLAGPTASGKTAEAVALALALGGPSRVELVGADSVQVYRGLSLGSAAPRPEELHGLQHHLVGILDLAEPFDASRFVALADAAVDAVRARGKIPLVVGGTGLYLQALVRGLAPGIPREPAVRAALEARAARGPEALAELHAELSRSDPTYAAKIHPTDPTRIVRALEVFQTSGVPYSEHHRRHQTQEPRYDARVFALDLPPEVLRARIEARTRTMLAQGWKAEVQKIIQEYNAEKIKPLQTVGQKQIVEYIHGRIPEARLEVEIFKATWKYARQQRTWLRGMAGVTWLKPGELTSGTGVAWVRGFVAGEEVGEWPGAAGGCLATVGSNPPCGHCRPRECS